MSEIDIELRLLAQDFLRVSDLQNELSGCLLKKTLLLKWEVVPCLTLKCHSLKAVTIKSTNVALVQNVTKRRVGFVVMKKEM